MKKGQITKKVQARRNFAKMLDKFLAKNMVSEEVLKNGLIGKLSDVKIYKPGKSLGKSL